MSLQRVFGLYTHETCCIIMNIMIIEAHASIMNHVWSEEVLQASKQVRNNLIIDYIDYSHPNMLCQS